MTFEAWTGSERVAAAFCLVVGLGMIPATATAQDPGPPASDTMARLRGVVVVQLAALAVPVVGAFVNLEGTAFATRTDSLGRFDLGAVPPGAHRMTLHHPWWQLRRMEPPSAIFSITAGETTEVDWVVPSPDLQGTESNPFRIDGVTATVDAAEQRRRIEGSSARYVGRAEIAEYRGMGLTVADLVRIRFVSLRSMPTPTGFGMECIQTRRMGEDGIQILHQGVNPAPDCPEQVAVIVDGVKILDPSTYLPTLSLDVVESVEFVPGVVAGARYGSGFAAGVLVVETRVR